jgi:hypothetical protein
VISWERQLSTDDADHADFLEGFWSANSVQAEKIALAKSIFNKGICGKLFLIPLGVDGFFAFRSWSLIDREYALTTDRPPQATPHPARGNRATDRSHD